MKKIYTSLLLILLSLKIVAQQPWAQPGAHWCYKDGDDVGIGFSGYIEIDRTGDTLINGIVCDVLTPHHVGVKWWTGGTSYNYYSANRYTYLSNDTVYTWDNGNFSILYNFNAQPGSYWVSPSGFYNICNGDTIRIDSTMITTVNAVSMKRIVPVPYVLNPFPNDPELIYHHDPAYEKFGSIGFLFPTDACVTDVPVPQLTFYDDSSGFSYTTNVTPYCHYILGVNDKSDIKDLIISANPGYNTITISLQLLNASQLKISLIDAMGREVFYSFEKYSGNNFRKEINTTQFSNGIYIVKLQNEEGVLTRKIIVRH